MQNKFLPSLAAILLCVLAAGPAPAADAVEPALLTFNSVRDEGSGYVNNVLYFDGASIRLTNCVLYAGISTNSDPQGLSEVAIQLRIGNAETSVVYSGTASDETAGIWSCDAVVPTNPGMCYLQVTITDVNTNSYIYPWKTLNHKPQL